MKKKNDPECYSPIEIAQRIEKNEFVLPRFQRELDWKTDRMAKLFDSIYKGFYINLVVLWNPKGDKPNYFFVRDYVYGKHNVFDRTTISSGKKFVLDGQQRFEAIFIGLCGSYQEKNGVIKELYFYIDDPGKEDNFVFVSKKEYQEKNLNKCFLLKVSDMRKYKNKNSIINNLIKDVENAIKEVNVRIANTTKEKEKKKLTEEMISYNEKINAIKKSSRRILLLHDKLYNRSIKYHMVGRNLDDDSVEELFVRMNTGGSQLSNSEIILSKLSTHWKKLNARDEVNSLIDKINNYHRNDDDKRVYDYSISLDFVMKSMLVLLDEPSVTFKINKIINDGNLLTKMEDRFNSIKDVLKAAFAFVKKYGFTHEVLRSNNAIIPIAYLLYKKLPKGETYKSFLDNKEYINLKKSMIKWLCFTILSNYWGGANDTLLVSLRKAINEYTGDIKDLDFYNYFKSIDARSSSRKMNYNTLLNLSYESNNAEVYPVLCVLYLNNNNYSSYIEGRYDVDHIFPQAKFNDECYDENNINKKKRKFYNKNLNLLPNLQLLKAVENREEKKAKYFDEWIREFYKTDDEIRRVLNDNFIDEVYKFDQFKIMFEKRKETLAKKLEDIFK